MLRELKEGRVLVEVLTVRSCDELEATGSGILPGEGGAGITMTLLSRGESVVFAVRTAQVDSWL
jgi:hypothetical protein